jgi:two-component system C4-dicarboxylate transport sensor histidine kinase DctB
VADQTPGRPGPTDLLTLNRGATVARLLAGVSHEINNALLVIGGTAEVLQGTPGLHGSVTIGLQRIADQNARAARAVRELMVFVRQNLDAPGCSSLREIAKQSVALRAYALGRSRLSIAVEAASNGRFLVYGNSALLQLASLNLILNAEQALAGQKGGAIRVSVTEAAGFVALSVSDNGPGVDPATADRLFEPFFTTRSRDEASGLGLTVARQIAEQHGGTLTLKPQDAGACFEMRLPAAGQPRS